MAEVRPEEGKLRHFVATDRTVRSLPSSDCASLADGTDELAAGGTARRAFREECGPQSLARFRDLKASAALDMAHEGADIVVGRALEDRVLVD